MTERNPDVVFAKAEQLEQKMDDLREAFDVVADRERLNRRLVVTLAIVSLLSVAAIVVAIAVAVQANNASNDAAKAVSATNINKTTQIATCVSSNDSRRVAKQLWDFLLNAALHGTPPPTAEAKKQLIQFQVMVDTAYAQRDCSPSAVAHSSPPPTK
jgi:hypothetical protein